MAAEGIIGIAARFGGTAAEAGERAGAGRRERLYRELHQTPIVFPQVPVTAGAGSAQPTDQAGPMTGYYWSVRRLAASGFTAGSVTVWRNAVVTGPGTAIGEQLFTFPQAGTYTFGRGEILLSPDDFLVLTAAGITLVTGQAGVSVIGSADILPALLLPDYLM